MKKIVCLVVCMLLLSGCAIKGDFAMGINSDKSIDFSVILAYDDELLEALMSMESESENETYTDEEKWEFLESSLESEENPVASGFDVSRYDQDGFKGFTFTKSIANIDDLTAETASFNITQDYAAISESKLFVKDGDNYVSKITYSPLTEDTDYSIEQEVFFKLTLPNEPISHNATSVSEDGLTLTWDLGAVSNTGNIDFTFKFATLPIVLIVIGIIALIGLGAGIAIILGMRKKKENKSENVINNNNDTQVQPTSNAQVNNQPNVEQLQNEFTMANAANMDMSVSANVEDITPSTPINTEPEVTQFNFVDTQTTSNAESEPNNPEQVTEEEVKIFSFDTLSSNQPTENTTNNQNSNLQ